MHLPPLSQLVTDVANLPAQSFEWGVLKWVCNDQLSPGSALTVGVCHILPGKCNPLHFHPNCEEVLYLLAGTGRHRLEDEWCELRPGQTIRIPVGVKHCLVNTGWDPLSCLVTFSSGQRETVFLE